MINTIFTQIMILSNLILIFCGIIIIRHIYSNYDSIYGMEKSWQFRSVEIIIIIFIVISIISILIIHLDILNLDILSLFKVNIEFYLNFAVSSFFVCISLMSVVLSILIGKFYVPLFMKEAYIIYKGKPSKGDNLTLERFGRLKKQIWVWFFFAIYISVSFFFYFVFPLISLISSST